LDFSRVAYRVERFLERGERLAPIRADVPTPRASNATRDERNESNWQRPLRQLRERRSDPLANAAAFDEQMRQASISRREGDQVTRDPVFSTLGAAGAATRARPNETIAERSELPLDRRDAGRACRRAAQEASRSRRASSASIALRIAIANHRSSLAVCTYPACLVKTPRAMTRGGLRLDSFRDRRTTSISPTPAIAIVAYVRARGVNPRSRVTMWKAGRLVVERCKTRTALTGGAALTRRSDRAREPGFAGETRAARAAELIASYRCGCTAVARRPSPFCRATRSHHRSGPQRASRPSRLRTVLRARLPLALPITSNVLAYFWCPL